MKIAVTGASGFVGRHVIAQLARIPVEIVAVTRDATRLNGLGGAIRIVEWDITDADAKCFELLGHPDTLIHLAWEGLPNYKSLRHFETELPRQFRFLKGLVAAGLPSLLVSGTCFEYGMQSGGLSEDVLAQPANPYGHAKNALREQLQFLKTMQPYALTWARLFFMYGDGQPKSSLLPQLRDAVSRGDKTFEMSGGEQLRDYLPVAEVARLIVELALHHPDAGVVNICAGAPISVRRLVEQWIRDSAWEIELNLGRYPYPDHESMAFWGSRSKLNSLLGNS
jgi:dTDP-6-deoxy-L-talose 4-dehydrogenase (NAD+)